MLRLGSVWNLKPEMSEGHNRALRGPPETGGGCPRSARHCRGCPGKEETGEVPACLQLGDIHIFFLLIIIIGPNMTWQWMPQNTWLIYLRLRDFYFEVSILMLRISAGHPWAKVWISRDCPRVSQQGHRAGSRGRTPLGCEEWLFYQVQHHRQYL